jgi:threonyl-tRNA synthetase
MATKVNQDKPIEKDWDHKKLGKELDLFTFSDLVGKGLPLWTPKGAAIRREIERFIVDEEIKRGYSHVYTPDIAKLDLYKKSGHYPYYKESMYAPLKIEDEEFMLRPMTCPHHFELFLDKPRSYKELPIRYAELAKLYRFEKSGELMGLQRVRSFCLADAHIICTKKQASDEIDSVLDLIEFVANTFGLIKEKDFHYRLSLGDRNDEKKYFKDDKSWDMSEDLLRKVLVDRKAKYEEANSEAAFYGPKIDVQMVNANGKEDTAFTVQYDFVMPKRFSLNYVNEEGGLTEAVVVHRSSVGAIERIIALLIEKYKGNFPTWLSPVQVKILPISEKHLDYANKIFNTLKENGTRVEIDERNETLGGKIRDAQIEKVSYMLIVGDKEEKNNTITERGRSGKDFGEQKLEDFIVNIKKEIEEKLIN